MLSQLEHPNICRLYEYIEAPEGDFLVLELVPGPARCAELIAGPGRGASGCASRRRWPRASWPPTP